MAAEPGQPPEAEQQRPAQLALPPVLGGTLQVAAAIAGASALFGALASFAGWQYLREYYRTIGIPFSALSFSTQDYLFATLPSVVFAFSGMVGAAMGVILGLLVPLPGTFGQLVASFRQFAIRMSESTLRPYYRIINRLFPEARVPAYASVFLAAYFLFAVLAYAILIVVIGFLFLGGWLIAIYGRQIGSATLAMGAFSFAGSFLVASFFRFRAVGPERRIYVVIISLLLVLALSFVIVFGPQFIGEAAANRDLNSQRNFVQATFVVKGKFDVPGERLIPTGLSNMQRQGQSCEEFTDAPEPSTRSLCKISNVRVILQNNDFYFVIQDYETARDQQTEQDEAGGQNAESEVPNRKIYAIPEDRVIRVTYGR